MNCLIHHRWKIKCWYRATDETTFSLLYVSHRLRHLPLSAFCNCWLRGLRPHCLPWFGAFWHSAHKVVHCTDLLCSSLSAAFSAIYWNPFTPVDFLSESFYAPVTHLTVGFTVFNFIIVYKVHWNKIWWKLDQFCSTLSS